MSETVGPEPTLEVDQTIPDCGDDGYESMDFSETLSITESLNQYVEQNGRRYHTYWGTDKNPLPSDNIEQDRLNLVHECTLIITGGRTHYAPVDQAHRVLDLGTGTGIWAIDYAQEHPNAEVVGIDISPIQPNWVPPNCKFEIDDFEADWNYKRPFDFINARTIAQSVTSWPRLLSQAKHHLTPGGYIELSEYGLLWRCDDNSIPSDWPPLRFLTLVQRAADKLGRTFPDGRALRNLLEEAGFEDIHVKHLKLPVGKWPRDQRLKAAGKMMLLTGESGYEAYGLQLLNKVLGMPEGEVVELCKEARAAHYVRGAERVHAYMDYYTVYGRKPLSE